MISDFIPTGHENKISRKKLSQITGFSDRRVRAEIAAETLSDNGQIILNNGDGYFIYSGQKDDLYLNAYLKKESRRFSSIGKKIKKLRKLKEKKTEQIAGQLSIFDFGGING